MKIKLNLEIEHSKIISMYEQKINENLDNIFDNFENVEQAKKWLQEKKIDIEFNNEQDFVNNSKYESLHNAYELEALQQDIVEHFLKKIEEKLINNDPKFIEHLNDLLGHYMNDEFFDFHEIELPDIFLNLTSVLEDYSLSKSKKKM